MQYRIIKTASGQLSIGGIECQTLDACIEQVRTTPIADGDQLLKPTDPVDGCWFHPSALERVAREAGTSTSVREVGPAVMSHSDES